jgi:hypothetical protein
VHLHSGGVFTGEDATAWDLDDVALRQRFLEPRTRGEQVWVKGKSFDWQNAELRVFEGPNTARIPEFLAPMGAPMYEIGGILADVTDRYVTGPPGRAPAAAADVPAHAVFIVHGRDDARKEAVARFVSTVLPHAPVLVLHEQANAGRTLIEKLEGTASVARFAIVILTADDEGRERGDDALTLRARQNVVFETGFFFGKFGRKHVVVLYEPGVELPSDLDGVAYVALDVPGAWKLQLCREMRAAGLEPDLNLSG